MGDKKVFGLREIIDIDPNFIFVKNREGRFVLVNQAVADAYGTTVDGLLGKSDADFNPNTEEVESFRRDDLEVMDTKREKVIPEEVITDASGERRYLSTIKRPIIDDDGTARHVLGVASDITRLKNTEAELRAKNANLQRLNEIKDEFVAVAAHELRTPLTSVVGYLDMILESRFGDVPDAMQRPLSAITRNIQRIKRLVDDMLEASRMQAGRIFMSLSEVDLGDLVNAVLLEIGPEAEKRHISLKALVSAPVRIVGDRDKLHQIISNLVVNALKYSIEGGLVTVRVQLLEHEGTQLAEVRVKDNGIGIPADALPHIFEAFFDGRSSRHHTSSQPDSAGLGLFIAKQLVELHRGSISVDSIEGEYTELAVVLPLEQAE